MEQDLLDALRKQYGDGPTPIMQQHLEFAQSTRLRARHLLKQFVKRTGRSLDGVRVLDVGCAHGGVVIEAAAHGAEAWGVEISRKLWRLGRLNARGEPGNINIVPGDFLSPQIAAQLPDDFAVVVVNDVFEHVYDTARLLAQLRRVMADDAVLLFKIPNGEWVESVAREGHNGQPGLSLVAANWWHAVVPSFTAFYRPWSYYTGLFRAFGFHDIQPWYTEPTLSVRKARKYIQKWLAQAQEQLSQLEYRDAKARPAMQAAFDDYRRRVNADLERGDPRVLRWRYILDFWHGCAIKTGPLLADIAEVPGMDGEDEAAGDEAADRPGGYRELQLARSPAELTTSWTQRTDTAIVAARRGGIRCDVVGFTGKDGGSGGQYGGIRLPVAAPRSLRLELELIEPGHIEALYIDGEDPRRCRVTRWKWPCQRRAPGERSSFELTPGESSEPFVAEEPSYPLLVTDIHVYIRVVPGTRAGFVLHSLAAR